MNNTISWWHFLVFTSAMVCIAGCAEAQFSSKNALSTDAEKLDSAQTPYPSPTIHSTPTSRPTVSACVNSHALTVRSGPGHDYEILDYLGEGDCITLELSNKDLTWARYASGWISTSFLDITEGSLKALNSGDQDPISETNGSSAAVSEITLEVISKYPCLPKNTERVKAEVVRVIDGDTIEVLQYGTVHEVRYIGINTPEYDQSFGSEATKENRALLSSGEVVLIKDVSEKDKYGRLLRYVISGGVFINKALVESGFAQASTYPPDVSCSNTFKVAQQKAREREFGFWGVAVIENQSPSNECHPSYPTVCIPPAPPDLDCGDISFRRFKVVGSDPHRFDGDYDGVGCEGSSSYNNDSNGSTGGSVNSGSKCHPSYPGVCIPPPPPDLDCGQISYRRFTVVGSDPHRFDGDNDGVGCER